MKNCLLNMGILNQKIIFFQNNPCYLWGFWTKIQKKWLHLMGILNTQFFFTKSDFFLIGKNDVTIFPNTKKFISSEVYMSKFWARSDKYGTHGKKRPATYGVFEPKFQKIPNFRHKNRNFSWRKLWRHNFPNIKKFILLKR